jgi:hypothetical protein
VVDVAPLDPPHVAYVRLRVVAKPHRLAAESVEVMVLAAREKCARPNTSNVGRVIPIDGQLLVFSNTNPLNPVTRLTIPSGMHRHVDLLQIEAASARYGNGVAQIEVKPTPTDKRHHTFAAEFEVDLAVTALNTDPRQFRVTVSFDGTWGEGKDAIWDHLTVSKPEPIDAPRWRQAARACGKWVVGKVPKWLKPGSS